jgi:hypothetical protein
MNFAHQVVRDRQKVRACAKDASFAELDDREWGADNRCVMTLENGSGHRQRGLLERRHHSKLPTDVMR